MATSVEFSAVISRNGVDHEQTNIVLFDGYWYLIADDVFLRFQIVDVRAVYLAQGRPIFW